jgi:peptidyl-prolyl cis-trans isomerase D
MLDIMRRKQRLKLVLWAVIASLGLGMLLFFIPGANMGDDTADNSAATVDGQTISLRDYMNAYRKAVDRVNSNGRNQVDPEMLRSMGFPKQVLDDMIATKVMKLIATRFGIGVSPAEIQRAIETHPSFQLEGKFIGVDSYKALLTSNNFSVTDFEEDISKVLLMKKLRDILTDSLDVSERELREEFSRTSQKTRVEYALLKQAEYKKRITPTEAELRSYFDGHKDAYRVKERRRAQYLLVPFAQFFPDLQVTDKEIEAEWNRQPHDETVDVAHILFNVSDSAHEAAVKAKAEEVLKRVKAGEDFAALAKKYSEDTQSSAKGGSLATLHRGKGQTLTEFEDAAFALKPGETSGLVRTESGFHIIKVFKHDKPSIQSSRVGLIMSIQLKKARDLAKKSAEDAGRQLAKQNDLGVAAGALNAKTEIKETRLIKNDDSPVDAGVSEALRDEIFALKAKDSIGKVVEDTMGYAIPKLLEVALPRPGDFAEFRDQIATDYADFKSKELLQADAQKLSQEASRQGSLETAARAMGLSTKTSDEFALSGTPSAEIGANSEFTRAAFDLEPGAVSAPQPIFDNVAVFQVKSRTPFDESAYQKMRPELRTRLLQSMQDPYFQSYIRRATEDMEKAGKIRMNSKALDQVASGY